MKDILIVRIPNKFKYEDFDFRLTAKGIKDVFDSQYLVMVILGENETDKTTFEIIKA